MPTTQERIEDIELQVRMIGSPEFHKDLHDDLVKAGFVVEVDDRISPDWESELGAKGLENLTAPQLHALVDVAHRDLAKRISQDVEKGMSVEDAYMARAATDPAATLIAEATIARNVRTQSLQAELTALREQAGMEREAGAEVARLGASFAEISKSMGHSPNAGRGFEQICKIVQKGMIARPALAKSIRDYTERALKADKLDWRTPEEAAKQVLDKYQEQTQEQAQEQTRKVEQRSLSDMSTKEFTQFAAKEYVRVFDAAVKSHDQATASTAAVAHLKDLAKRAKLRISFREVSDKDLQAASKSAPAVEKLLTGKVKPPRTASLGKANNRDRENDR